ncbi:glycosyltransferase 87 family protein [Actinoplanes sp. RD1]|uniref:glycosyltransferase 87 family protein n=1 Tax=Actinoplanes sp. RD1 TaxID=3064538 RepID=UPI002741E717|nr:glycosyltransferase 87 family protein [Actinoplanes sp. RD1]
MRLPGRIDQTVGDAALYGLSAAFALVTALTSTLLPHRAWGAVAFWAYLAGFVIVAVQLVSRRPAFRLTLTWLVWGGSALLPLVVQAVQRAGGRTDRAQEEVLVAEQMGERLAHTGTPYLNRDAILALPPGEQLLGYAPYQPGMGIFGLPRAWFGDSWVTDARVWFALVTAGALVAALALVGPQVRALQFATVLPICALTLATGGDDLPVLALCLLALACCATGRYAAAGLAVGAAAALKLFAFPVLAVLVVLAWRTGNLRRFLPGAIGLPVLTLLPVFAVDAGAFVENVFRFPLGHGVVTSPAQSPFPGYLISQAVPGGRYVAAALLVAVALAILVLLLRRPPRTAAAAALFSGYGLLAAILLMPTTRFGYLLYPLALLVWAPALRQYTALEAPRSDTALYRL